MRYLNAKNTFLKFNFGNYLPTIILWKDLNYGKRQITHVIVF